MKLTLTYSAYSGTIRQMPQNYLIAHQVNFSTSSAYWECVPDLAADVKLATKVFKALFDFETKYGTAQRLLKKVGF